MKFSKKLLLTQVVALAATSAAYAANIDTYIAGGNEVLAPMLTNNVNDFGVNNELFLLTQKQSGNLSEEVFFVNGRLNASVNWFNVSPHIDIGPTLGATPIPTNLTSYPVVSSSSEVMNPGLDLAVTATKGLFTAFVHLSTNQGSNGFLRFDGNSDNYSSLGLGVLPYNLGVYSKEFVDPASYDPNQQGIGLQQAFLMMGDLSKMPVYALVGRKYVDFGSFSNDEQLWQPVTNLFNQNVQNQISVGYYDHGVHAAATVFRNEWAQDTGGKHLASFVGTASYGATINNIGFHAGASLTTNVNHQLFDFADGGFDTSYQRAEAGILFGEVAFKPVTVTANYAQVMKNMSDNIGKPHAWDLGAKVKFNLMNMANWASINYSSINFKPHVSKATLDQWLLGWNMSFTKNLSATLQYGHATWDDQGQKTKFNFVNLGAYYHF